MGVGSSSTSHPAGGARGALFRVLASLVLLHVVPVSPAGTIHVWTNSPANGPGTAWSNAFHVIQEAIDAASSNDTVRVTNGIYATGGAVTPGASLTSRVVVSKPIMVESTGGKASTWIVGAGPPGDGAVRCTYLAEGAVLRGFTLRNGHTRLDGADPGDRMGGGALLDGGGLLRDCHLADNQAISGGGVFLDQGGVVSNCTLTGNEAVAEGGGAYCNYDGQLVGCRLWSNSVTGATGRGGGVSCWYGGRLVDCVISNHWVADYGGGVNCYYGGELDHCTVTHNSAAAGAGGVYCNSGGLLTDCTVTNNWTTGLPGKGGGVRCHEGGTLVQCVLTDNTAALGGGVACDSGGGLTHCTLTGNTATAEGGGARCETGGTLSDCLLSGNQATGGSSSGGGVYLSYGGRLDRCILSGNFAGDAGGGVYCILGGVVADCTLAGNTAAADGGGAYLNYAGAFLDCVFTGNTAVLGGGVYCDHDGGLTNCTFSGNTATNRGGGAYFDSGGGLDRCLLRGNQAADGGGAYCHWGGTLNNSLLAANQSGQGGGAYCFFGGLLNHCTIVTNTAQTGGGIYRRLLGQVRNTIIHFNHAGAGPDRWEDGSTPAYQYCCSPGLTDPGCIGVDPQFSGAEPGNYRLSYGSPCIDTANNTYMAGDADRYGGPRLVDGNADGTNTVDIGCHEYNAMTDNTDGDAHTDFQEMIADTDLADGNDYFVVTALANPPPFTIYFVSSSNRLYTLHQCTDPASGTWTEVPGQVRMPGAGGPDSLEDTNTLAGARGYRVAVQLP